MLHSSLDAAGGTRPGEMNSVMDVRTLRPLLQRRSTVDVGAHGRGVPPLPSIPLRFLSFAQLVWLAAPPVTHVKLDAMVTSPVPLYRGHDG